jgi:site-specific DNA-methyltransferase (adenine-specific)
MNFLYYGDNLDILKRFIDTESVDLIYLDPPFNSNEIYNIIYKEENGNDSTAQIKAFDDTWHWGTESIRTYENIVTGEDTGLSEVLQGFRRMIGECNMLAYLIMMAPRLVELKRVLKQTGSIYLHCDWHADAYLRVLCDSIFGGPNFINQIIWKRTDAKGNAGSSFNVVTDTILLYKKGDNCTFHPQDLSGITKRQMRDYKIDSASGRYYKLNDLTAPGGKNNFEWRGVRPKSRSWLYPLEKLEEMYSKGEIKCDAEGKPIQCGHIQWFDVVPSKKVDNLWTDIGRIGNTSPERLGYPTQKPIALLERIIKASSNPDDLVLDPFCGCGTTIDAAQKLGRLWIGIDITSIATAHIKARLIQNYGFDAISKNNLTIIGEPTTKTEARALAKQDKYQFQWWATGLIGVHPVDPRKGADKGIDGRIYFNEDPNQRTPSQIIIQVKGGENISVKDIRDLRGTMEREEAVMAIYICVDEPTKPMIIEAASAGHYTVRNELGGEYPRIQIVTIGDILDGQMPKMPASAKIKILATVQANGSESDATQAPKLLPKTRQKRLASKQVTETTGNRKNS